MSRSLYLVAYDICKPSRLRKTLTILKDYASGGQKSAFECYLTVSERDELLFRVEQVMDASDDAFLVIKLRSREAVDVLGCAIKPSDELYTYLG